MSVTHLLIHRATVQRNSPVDLGKGKWQDNYVAIATNIRFRFSGNSGSEVTTGDQLKTYTQYNGYAEPGQDIQRGDYVVGITREDGTVDPRSYRVTGVVPPSKRHHTKVTLEEIQKGA